MQTKNNLWVSATIIANIIIVGVLVSIVIVIAGFGYLVFSGGSAAFASSTTTEDILVSIIIYILGSALLVFSIWLGIRSVLKKTPIDPQNHTKITLIIISAAVALQILSLIYSYWLLGPNGLKVGTLLLLIVNDFVLFLSTFYFLKRNMNEENKKSYLFALAIVLIIGLGLTFWTAQKDASITDMNSIQPDDALLIKSDFDKEFRSSFYSADRTNNEYWYCEEVSSIVPFSRTRDKIIFRCQKGSELADMIGTSELLLVETHSALANYSAWAYKSANGSIEGHQDFAVGQEMQPDFTQEEAEAFFNKYAALYVEQLNGGLQANSDWKTLLKD